MLIHYDYCVHKITIDVYSTVHCKVYYIIIKKRLKLKTSLRYIKDGIIVFVSYLIIFL